MKHIAVTPGEPAGIGPDIVLQYWHHYAYQHKIPLKVFADKNLMHQRAQQLHLPVNITEQLPIHHIALPTPVTPGTPNPDNATYLLDCLNQATAACLHHDCHALTTGPIHKATINQAGIPFSGHTEYLAQLCHVDQPVMMLMTAQLKVALVTTHLPLTKVPQAITREWLTQCISILHHDLKHRFNIHHPRILVLGLNPHAGEGGHLGNEEQTTIIPVLNQLREQGLKLIGPVSADTAFIPESLDQCDVVLAMYHDQGLPVLKQQGFGEAVNVTLGLPIIRTSVDHGTAFSLAGTGKSRWESLATAIETAHKLVNTNVSTSQAA